VQGGGGNQDVAIGDVRTPLAGPVLMTTPVAPNRWAKAAIASRNRIPDSRRSRDRVEHGPADATQSADLLDFRPDAVMPATSDFATPVAKALPECRQAIHHASNSIRGGG
jgi:hypothetical protein